MKNETPRYVQTDMNKLDNEDPKQLTSDTFNNVCHTSNTNKKIILLKDTKKQTRLL